MLPAELRDPNIVQLAHLPPHRLLFTFGRYNCIADEIWAVDLADDATAGPTQLVSALMKPYSNFEQRLGSFLSQFHAGPHADTPHVTHPMPILIGCWLVLSACSSMVLQADGAPDSRHFLSPPPPPLGTATHCRAGPTVQRLGHHFLPRFLPRFLPLFFTSTFAVATVPDRVVYTMLLDVL